MKVFLLSFALLFLGSVTAQAVTRYVKQTASGTGNGSSWANASNNLQAMINASASGDAVWVAAGTYKPTLDHFSNANPTNPRNKTFYVKDGVKIYGGFAGTETTLAARSIATNVTTLSGDIGTIGVNTDNCYHVLLASPTFSSAIGVTIDGFTITYGNTDGGADITVKGNVIRQGFGSAIYIIYGTNIINNTTILNNIGKAMYTNYGTNTITNATILNNTGNGIYTHYGTGTITNSTISDNGATAGSGGSGIYANLSTITILNSTISNNNGGIRIYSAPSAIISNNIVANNTYTLDGGGIYVGGTTNCKITNNTIIGNISYNSYGGGVYSGSSTFTNNIFFGNKQGVNTNVQGADFYSRSSTFKNNILQLASSNYTTSGGSTGNYDLGTTATGNIFATDPLFLNAADPDGADNIHRTADDGLRLQAGSPAINAGDPTITTPLTDIIGATRGASPFDLGAYEGGVLLCATPTAYTLTGGGAYCAGGVGVAVGLANSETGVSYQLQLNGIDNGAAISGTGAAIDFGIKTAAGTYSVVATRTVGGCMNTMSNTVVITQGISTTGNQNVTACDTYTWANNNTTYTTSGIYSHITTNASGCTHTEFLNLTIEFGVPNYTTETACDAYTWAINNTTYTTSGTYVVTNYIGGSSNCPHDEVLVLTINSATSRITSETACDTYTWAENNMTYTSSGTYSHISTNAWGCTHTEILYLTINPSTSSHTSANACTDYTWGVNGTTYTVGGTYTYDTNVNGCIHTDYLHLHLNQVLYFSQTETACNSYTWQRNGQTYTQSGTYTYNDPNVGACGSEETLILTINNNTTNTTDISVCTSYTWAVDNNTYYTSGTYTYSTTLAFGCTHTEILNLTIEPAPLNYTTETACDAYTWAINNTTYTASGTYFVSNYVGGVSNCPHDEVLDLTINSATSHTVDETACDTYTWAENNMTYTASGTYSHISTNAWGCTHTEILNLTINTPPSITTQPAPIVICTYKTGSATVVAIGTGLTYQWQYSNNNGASVTGDAGDTGNNTATISNVPTTIVLLRCKITATNGCIAYSNWIGVTTNPLPTLTITGATTGTGSVSLTADIGPGGTYVWSMGSTPNAASNTFTTVGTHSVTIIGTDVNGCSAYNVADIRVIADCPTATTLYVNDDATGANNGTSWADAYTSLSQALHIAHTCPTVLRINVATGTYKPTKKPYNSGIEMTTTDARDVTFHVRDGLGIYGGYDATTGLRTEAPFGGSGGGGSILNGDIGTIGVNTDNVYHVVLASAASSGGIGVTVDGFTITMGNANNTSYITVKGNRIYMYSGGGIYSVYGTNMLTNNTLSGNTATYGGGIYSHNGTNTLTSNILFGNTANIYGGGIYTNNGTNALTNNTLSGNTANNYGGGIYTYNGTNTLTNNTLSGNTATYGGGIYTSNGTNTLTNNIFWGNKKGTDATILGADYYKNNSTNTFKNNMLQLASSNYTGTNYALGIAAVNNIFAQTPNFIDATDPDGADNIYRTADDGLRLACGSLAINAGTDIGAPTTDILNNTNVSAKDIGAYESQIDCINTIYSDAAACKTFTINNVSGNGWFHIYGTNGILASINPNGSDLGTVTAEVSDATDAIDFNNSKFLGRSINFTSSNYASSATMPNNYNLRIYYYDTELTEYNAATQGSFTTADLNMAWKEGGTGCSLTTYSGSNNGLIASADVTEADYGTTPPLGGGGLNGFYLDFTLNHFTIFAATTASPTPLPVKWLKIAATPLATNGKINDRVMVEWATASELNLSHYIVERGTMQNGSLTWANIGRVTGKNSPTGAYYNFYDTNIQGLDEAYYRIISVDFDGTTEASKTVFVNFRNDTETSIYPNPTNNIINISVEAHNRELPTEIRDIHGKQIYTYKTVPFQIDLSALPSGVYLLQIGSNVRKVVKE